MNPRIGSRVQQTCEPEAEKAGEVANNHEAGTGCLERNLQDRSGGGDTEAGVDAEGHVDGGAYESQERRSAILTGGTRRALERSEAPRLVPRRGGDTRPRTAQEMEPSRVSRVTGKTEEGAGKSNDPQHPCTGARDRFERTVVQTPRP